MTVEVSEIRVNKMKDSTKIIRETPFSSTYTLMLYCAKSVP